MLLAKSLPHTPRETGLPAYLCFEFAMQEISPNMLFIVMAGINAFCATAV